MRSKAADSVFYTAKIVIGSLLYAVGFQFFLYPNDIVTGGVTGIAMILNYLLGLPVGVMTIVINIPLFLLSWKQFGSRFLVGSFLGTVLSGAAVDILALFPVEITHEPLLAAVYGGLIKGFGLGIIYHAGATTGGVDIIAKLLRRRWPYLNFSTLLLGLDAAVIVLFAVIFHKYDSAMYAVICMFVASKTIDLVLFGAVNSKVCYIVTEKSGELNAAISAQLHRGVTFLHGQGGWSGAETQVILCVIKQHQIVELRKLVQSVDARAFVIVCDSREVFGQGFSDIGETD